LAGNDFCVSQSANEQRRLLFFALPNPPDGFTPQHTLANLHINLL
jgi:hypothetical protein